jgi:surface protein
MVDMFKGCLKFNGDISVWDVENVTNMFRIFNGCVDFKRDVSPWVMTSIQNNESAPTFTNAYITEVKPNFSTGNPNAWNFRAPVNRNVLNVILPEINSRKLYYIDRYLRLRLATDKDGVKSKFSQSVITRSYKTPIIKYYL